MLEDEWNMPFPSKKQSNWCVEFFLCCNTEIRCVRCSRSAGTTSTAVLQCTATGWSTGRRTTNCDAPLPTNRAGTAATRSNPCPRRTRRTRGPFQPPIATTGVGGWAWNAVVISWTIPARWDVPRASTRWPPWPPLRTTLWPPPTASNPRAWTR